MSQILERVGRPSNGFRPNNEPEFFALQLARRLGEATNVKHYLSLVEHHSREDLLEAYRAMMRSHPVASQVLNQFNRELKRRSRKAEG